MKYRLWVGLLIRVIVETSIMETMKLVGNSGKDGGCMTFRILNYPIIGVVRVSIETQLNHTLDERV